ncbi:MAG: VWA domain-containing protein [Myxococcaceae bacterium]
MIRKVIFLIGAVVALASCSSGVNGADCSATSPCSGGQTCLAIGMCADRCEADDQCGGGSKCAASGGCVPTTSCGGSLDCQAGTICSATGTCVKPCDQTGCATGETCLTSGRCVTTTATTPAADGGAIEGGTAGAPAIPRSCGGELYAAKPLQANFLIVLDHSGSMEELVGGSSKWSAAVSAVKAITSKNDAAIRFGLQMFSLDNIRCAPGVTDVEIGDKTTAKIAAALPAVANGERTPIGAALNVASKNLDLTDTTRANNVLLITDGMENCNGKPVDEVKTLFGKGVKTYVVGFGGQVDGNMLSSMATQGGTALPAAKRYYQADDPASLNSAFTSVANGALGCDLKLSVPPPDPARIFVYVDGQQQNRDPSKVNGWEFVPAGNRIALFGGTCGLLTTNPNAKVTVVYGCADSTIVPGGAGSVCTVDNQCGSNKCTAGLCEGVPAKPNGSACQTNAQCQSGLCTNGICEGGVPGKPVGAPCTVNTECATGQCINNFCGSLIN